MHADGDMSLRALGVNQADMTAYLASDHKSEPLQCGDHLSRRHSRHPIAPALARVRGAM